MTRGIPALTAGILLGLLLPCLATDRFVAKDNPGAAAPYTNWGSAAASIQDAIDVSMDGDFILVTNGVYDAGGRSGWPGGSPLTNRIALYKPVTVQSVNGPGATIIVGQGPHGNSAVRGAYLTNGALLSGFTLTNGFTMTTGVVVAGVRFLDGWMTSEGPASNLVYADVGGGGVWSESGGAISNCVVSGNAAVQCGGGLFGGTAFNSSFVCNGAEWDGGGLHEGSVYACEVRDNTCGRKGGGAQGGSLYDSLLRGNRSDSGGGASGSRLVNCTIVSNVASATMNSCGGALNSTLWNCIILSNYSREFVSGPSPLPPPFGGGGSAIRGILYIPPGLSALGERSNVSGGSLSNCITWPGQVTDEAHEDAQIFVAPSSDDYRLVYGSPCIDSGSNAFVVGGQDLDHNARIVNGTVDRGAFEFQWTSIPPVAVMNTGAKDVGTNNATLRGRLVSDGGGSDPHVAAFWGASDGGTDPAAWAYSSDLGTQGMGSISGQVANLAAGATYCYTFRVSNELGVAWAATSSVFTASPGVLLTIESDLGQSDPPVGVHRYLPSATVKVSVTNALLGGGTTQYLCAGWTGAGSVPVSGADTACVFVISEGSSLEWRWTTNYWLDAGVVGGGSVGISDGWYPAGMVISVTATPPPEMHFDSWAGDVSDSQATANPLVLTMSCARAISASFVSNSYMSIDVTPDDSEWTLVSFPAGYTGARNGTGEMAVAVVPTGTYSILYVAKSPYGTPPPQTMILTLGSSVNFAGVYSGTARRPSLSWASTPGATWYHLWIYRNGTNCLKQWLHQTGTNWVSDTDFKGGSYTWYVRGWSKIGGYGAWSSRKSFTVATQVPGKITGLDPSGDIYGAMQSYRWQGDGTSTWYRLVVNRNGMTWTDKWCHPGPVTGVVTQTLDGHISASSYRWWVRGWTPDGIGPWSSVTSFNIP